MSDSTVTVGDKGAAGRAAEFNVGALSTDTMKVSLVREGLPVPKTASATAMARALQKHFDASGKALVRCDDCLGVSPSDPVAYPACPFCGSAEPIEEVPGAVRDIVAAKLVGPVRVGEIAVAPLSEVVVDDAAPPAGGLVLHSGEVLPAERGADEKKLDGALERARVYRQEMKGAGWDLGNVLREIEERKLYLARRDSKGAPVHSTFDDFCEREFDCSGRWARSMIDVAREFTREQAMGLGARKLTPLLRLGAAERQEMVARAAEMTTREVEREVAAKTEGQPRRESAREGDTAIPTNGQPSRRAAIRELVAQKPELRDKPREVAKALGLDVSAKVVKKALQPTKAQLKSTKDLPTKHARVFPRPVDQAAQAAAAAETAKKPRPKKLTVIALEGRAAVALYARRRKPSDVRRAQSLADEPQGRLRMQNGTEVLISLRMGKAGLVCDVTFAEVVDPGAGG